MRPAAVVGCFVTFVVCGTRVTEIVAGTAVVACVVICVVVSVTSRVVCVVINVASCVRFSVVATVWVVASEVVTAGCVFSFSEHAASKDTVRIITAAAIILNFTWFPPGCAFSSFWFRVFPEKRQK